MRSTIKHPARHSPGLGGPLPLSQTSALAASSSSHPSCSGLFPCAKQRPRSATRHQPKPRSPFPCDTSHTTAFGTGGSFCLLTRLPYKQPGNRFPLKYQEGDATGMHSYVGTPCHYTQQPQSLLPLRTLLLSTRRWLPSGWEPAPDSGWEQQFQGADSNQQGASFLGYIPSPGTDRWGIFSPYFKIS